ncbi:MAG: flagellar basal body rod protein FlgC [Fuerstiella sp.]
MGFGNILSSTNISASGLSSERLRMEVAANNLANANTTSTKDGGPYRRQVVRFGSVMTETLGGRTNADGLGGVEVLGVEADTSDLVEVYQPGHPDAKANGFVTMPNVAIPEEMVDLMSASRAYEANLKSMTTFRKMAEQALGLMSPR